MYHAVYSVGTYPQSILGIYIKISYTYAVQHIHQLIVCYDPAVLINYHKTVISSYVQTAVKFRNTVYDTGKTIYVVKACKFTSLKIGKSSSVGCEPIIPLKIHQHVTHGFIHVKSAHQIYPAVSSYIGNTIICQNPYLGSVVYHLIDTGQISC